VRPAVAAIAGLCAVAVLGGAWAAMAGMRAEPALSAPLATWDPADPDLGRKAYAMCLGCHGADGRGVPGYAPGLAGSPWLAGDARAAVLMVLHGYDATSEPGAAYHSSRMLGHGHQLADHELAGLLTWARRQWGHGAEPVERAMVTALRSRHAGRATPWSPAELRAILAGP